jgi:hypothetical protein
MRGRDGGRLRDDRARSADVSAHTRTRRVLLLSAFSSFLRAHRCFVSRAYLVSCVRRLRGVRPRRAAGNGSIGAEEVHNDEARRRHISHVRTTIAILQADTYTRTGRQHYHR